MAFLDLASPPGSGVGDGPADAVIINGIDGDDAATVAGDAGDDVLIGGPRVDVLDGRPGDNILIQD